jgi:hypothetical protein
MDQIDESNWTFTRIKQDIAQSLRGGGSGGTNPPPIDPGFPGTNPGITLECTSRNGRYTECPSTLRFPQLVQQLSSTQCVEGQTWGARNGLIWVDRGCRARFGEGTPPAVAGRSFECSSRNNRRVNCPTNSQWPVRLQRQLSGSACIEGQTWGQGGGTVWVDRGCRAVFEEMVGSHVGGSGNGNAAQLVCESSGSGTRICPWDTRTGFPQLLREYSRGLCVQGRTWGVDQRGLWVSGGCGGLFGLR